MSTYEYTIIDLRNAIQKGRISAWSKRGASKKIISEGESIVTLNRVSRQTSIWRKIFRHISRMDRIVLMRNLMTMMRAGLNLSEALASSREQTSNPLMKRVLAEIEKEILAGQTFSAALSKHPKLFTPVTLAMIKVGERGGKLIECLEFLVKQQEEDYRLLRRVRNALVYPTLIVATMIGIVIIMMIFVIPKISAIYVEANTALPFYTAALINISNFMASRGLYLLAVLIALFFLLRAEARHSKSFRKSLHRLALRLPLVGSMVKKLNLSVVCRSLCMLTRAGFSIDESLILVSRVANNALYQEAIKSAVPFVRRGVKLTDVFKGQPDLFLPLFQKMVMTGEETGYLDDMFGHVAKYYDDDIEHVTANLSSMIEPVLLLGTGVVVFGVAFSVIFPLWNFANIL
jgi:type IV pilus assembly protein PilC